MTIKFGTDGWRGIIADDFTFDNVRACAQGTSNYLLQNGLGKHGLVVGYDTRFGSAAFAKSVAEVAAGNGLTTYLSIAPAPTPVMSYNIVARRAGGAAIITASHNPSEWNGFKYKPEYAGSASPEIVASLEKYINAIYSANHVTAIPWHEALATGVGQNIDPKVPYMEHVANLVDLPKLSNSGLKLSVDAMYGAGAGYISALVGGSKTKIQEIHEDPNPLFPGMSQPEPAASNLTMLTEAVITNKSDAGLALDGDADRFGLIDEYGTFITPLQVFAMLALYMLETKGERGPFVKSITATSMIYKLGKLFNVPVYETPVGFKYIAPVMQERNALMGGEESGGFGFRGHIPERDGILTGLFLMDMMITTGKRPSELLDHLFEVVGPHYYLRHDVTFDADNRTSLQNRLRDIKASSINGKKIINQGLIEEENQISGARFVLEDDSWVILRFSGTEPLLRIYSEGETPEKVSAIIEAARALLGVE